MTKISEAHLPTCGPSVPVGSTRSCSWRDAHPGSRNSLPLRPSTHTLPESRASSGLCRSEFWTPVGFTIPKGFGSREKRVMDGGRGRAVLSWDLSDARWCRTHFSSKFYKPRHARSVSAPAETLGAGMCAPIPTRGHPSKPATFAGALPMGAILSCPVTSLLSQGCPGHTSPNLKAER